MNGLVPYKDLLDIKGPIIFFLYAIFSPIKIGTNYFGIFILETIALWVSVTFIYKTIFLFSKSKKWSIALTLIYPFILLNMGSFITGGEAEEFIIPFVFILIYNTIKIVKNNYKISKLQYLFLGFSVGFVFWIKYTCIGAWVAFYLSIFIIFIYRKNFNSLIKMIIFSFLGFLIPTIFVLTYFIYNHAFYDLLWGYFGWNYIYGGSTQKNLISQLLFMFCRSLSIFFRRNNLNWLLVVLGPYSVIFFSKLFNKKSTRIMLAFMTFCSMCMVLSGGFEYPYYQLMAYPFSVLTFCWIAVKFKKISIKKEKLILLFSLISIIGILLVNPSIKESKLTGYEPYQKRFAKIILKDGKNPTFLDFNELDRGWYNYLNLYPPIKDFNKMNLHHNGIYKPYTRAQINIVKNKKVKYIICPVTKYKEDIKMNKNVFKNYRIIAQHKFKNSWMDKIILLERK